MRLYKKYNITEETDFVNVEINGDNKIWIDPMMIHMDSSELGIRCCEIIKEYFDKLLYCATTRDDNTAYCLYKHFVEMNETRTGYSKEKPKGLSGGKGLGKTIYDIIKNSEALNTLAVRDIFDSSVMIKGLGIDKLSDFISSLIFEELIIYTQLKCEEYEIPMLPIEIKHKYWSQSRNKWINGTVELPFDEESNLAIVFLPKRFVEKNLVYSHNRFYKDAMLPYLYDDAVRNRLEGLIRILKDESIKPNKTAIRKKYPCKRNVINHFIEEHSSVYLDYRERKMKYLSYNNYK